MMAAKLRLGWSALGYWKPMCAISAKNYGLLGTLYAAGWRKAALLRSSRMNVGDLERSAVQCALVVVETAI